LQKVRPSCFENYLYTENPVILSGVAPSRREGVTQSKDPYCTNELIRLRSWLCSE
jgi:hypothetical protein